MRGLLVYVAGLPDERHSTAELRRLVTAAEDDLADTLADMLADPERERGSVLSTVVRHTVWLDDPRLCAALARSEFDLADLKRRPTTVYLAIPGYPGQGRKVRRWALPDATRLFYSVKRTFDKVKQISQAMNCLMEDFLTSASPSCGRRRALSAKSVIRSKLG